MNYIFKAFQNIFGYSRVSTKGQDDKNSTSLQAQTLKIQTFAQNNKLDLKNVSFEIGSAFTTCGKNGKSRQPVLSTLINTIPKNSIIIVTSYDRFSRNLKIALERIDQCLLRNIIIYSIDENIDYRTSSGRFTFSQLISNYEHQSRMCGEKVKLSNAYKKEQGSYLGKAPYGYEKYKSMQLSLKHNMNEEIVNGDEKAKNGEKNGKLKLCMNKNIYKLFLAILFQSIWERNIYENNTLLS